MVKVFNALNRRFSWKMTGHTPRRAQGVGWRREHHHRLATVAAGGLGTVPAQAREGVGPPADDTSSPAHRQDSDDHRVEQKNLKGQQGQHCHVAAPEKLFRDPFRREAEHLRTGLQGCGQHPHQRGPEEGASTEQHAVGHDAVDRLSTPFAQARERRARAVPGARPVPDRSCVGASMFNSAIQYLRAADFPRPGETPTVPWLYPYPRATPCLRPQCATTPTRFSARDTTQVV